MERGDEGAPAEFRLESEPDVSGDANHGEQARKHAALEQFVADLAAHRIRFPDDNALAKRGGNLAGDFFGRLPTLQRHADQNGSPAVRRGYVVFLEPGGGNLSPDLLDVKRGW